MIHDQQPVPERWLPGVKVKESKQNMRRLDCQHSEPQSEFAETERAYPLAPGYRPASNPNRRNR